jgi:hypothetical protein
MNGLVKVIERESQGMKESVVGLSDVFSHEVMGKMAIIADGDMPMAGLPPGIQMTLHHMAVGAVVGIVAEIARPFRIPKGKRPHAGEDSQQNDNQNEQDRRPREALTPGAEL